MHRRVELPAEAMIHMSHAPTKGFEYDDDIRTACFRIQLRTNHDKVSAGQTATQAITQVMLQLVLGIF